MTYICAIIKDEQLFLKEWLDYHLSLGFDRIFLYEDFDSKSHKDITDLYVNVELHSMTEIPTCEPNKVGRQCAVYNYFCKTHNEGWCLFTDIDEYLCLEKGVTLKSLTQQFLNCVGLEIWWKCYGANKYIQHPQLTLVDAYHDDYRESWNPYWQFKSFVNLKEASKYTGLQSHFINCHFHKRIVTTEGKKADYRLSRNKPLKTYKLAWIDHYITKSFEDYVNRLKRGNITKGIRNIDFFFKLNPDMLSLSGELIKQYKLLLDEYTLDIYSKIQE